MGQNYGYRENKSRERYRLESRFSSQTYFLKINSSTLLSFTRKCTALQSINLDPTRDHRRDRAVAPRVMARVGNSNVEQSCPRETTILFSPCHSDTIFTRRWSKSDFTKIVAYFRGENGTYVIYTDPYNEDLYTVCITGIQSSRKCK